MIRGKKIIFLCGLIGSGKTTYAQQHFDYFTDLDYMPRHCKKRDQIRWTLNLLKKHNEVCHITCLPTKEELVSFRHIPYEIQWINADFEQAKTNILIRNRQRDIENLPRVLKANLEYERRAKVAIKMLKVLNVYRGRG